jgi:hypothetical protein
MQLQNIEFLHQFRQEQVDLPAEERQYRNALFMHFSNSRKERCRLEKFLENFTTQSDLLGALVTDMERQDTVIDRRLRTFLGKRLKTFAAYSRKEPYTAACFTRLSGEMVRFLNLSTHSRNRMQALFDKAPNSVDIRDLRRVTRQYLDTVYSYHDIFAALLDEELGRTGTTNLTSPVEEALYKLITLIKSQIYLLEATVNRLDEWRARYRELIAQGIYN